MKQEFLIKRGTPGLTVFFTGWGMDRFPFEEIESEQDLLLCYDYKSLGFHPQILAGYKKIKIVAWSMGVWAASQILNHLSLPVSESIAINGTPQPVDEQEGIPFDIYGGTLAHLNDVTLHKFYLRMCGSRSLYNIFLSKKPQRTLGDIKEELKKIGDESLSVSANPFTRWSSVYIGEKDFIFPVMNQQRAWTNRGIIFDKLPVAHYDEAFFRKILKNG